MSERAKIASLQEKIREARNRARTITIGMFISFLIAATGIVLYVGFDGGFLSLSLVVLGVVLIILCQIAIWSVDRTKKEWLEELASMASKISTCAKCGKQIPQGNFAFCPFCGTELTRR